MIRNPILPQPVDQTGVSFFQNAIPAAVNLVLVIGSLIFFSMLIWGAITWISAGGDKEGIVSARGRMTNALIGIVILFASFAIVKAIEYFFGIHILTLDIFPLVIQ